MQNDVPAPAPLYRSLYFQVLVAIVIGVALGHYHPETGVKLKVLGDAFIAVIKVLIGPIIFCTVVTGIVGMGSLKALGKTGLLALLYFEVVSTLALVVGLAVVNVVEPGAGMNVDPATLDPRAVQDYAQAAQRQSATGFLVHVVSNTFVLQVLVFSLVFGLVLHAVGERARPITSGVERLSKLLFLVVGFVMRFAPIAAFGAMAFTIGRYGVKTLASLGQLMACFYATCLLFVFVVLGAIARAHRFSIFRFVRYLREELFIVLGTSSSESVLPRMMARMEQAGCAKSVVGLVIPTGYSFNLDGTSIYLTMAAVFIAQATNTPMTLTDQVTLLIVLLLTSKGAAGVTGSGFIVLAMTLSALGTLPVAGLTLILGIDRFMSEARALTNLVGNGVATIVVARWCGALDERKLHEELNGKGERVAAGAES
jgi:aerobic C4-dicarboxylate transport protein